MKKFTVFTYLVSIILLSFSQNVFSQGKVYLVLGSDTAIWDGLGTATYHDTYNYSLYTDISRNAYKVMDDAFRNQIKDSYGNTLKMTWWMMAGNVYRFATNKNLPLANTMTLYLMKRFHGDKVKQWGDELSLHYHTFYWSDYNNDGKFYWNQAQEFNQCRDDFNVTLAEFLLEENTFPVSFRSGWHYMDNDWQHYLNKLLPFSLHNDYPNVHKDTTEPIDNDYDWSKATGEFVPFHPSDDNYQLPGNGKGWNVRSIYMARMDTALMGHVFSQAKKGIDQVVCLWAHLPEDDFLDNITRINQIAHQVAAEYPDVKFEYCTAVEAMQKWLKSSDTTAPNITFTPNESNGKINFNISTDENIFQAQPVVAIKNRDGNYTLINSKETGNNSWQTDDLDISQLAKVGFEVTDTVGNQKTAFYNVLDDDQFIDNSDSQYSEDYGSWSNSTNTAWTGQARTAVVNPNDSAASKFNFHINKSGPYNIFVQVPALTNGINKIRFDILNNGNRIASKLFPNTIKSGDWVYVFTPDLQANSDYSFEATGINNTSSSKDFAVNVTKISPLVWQRRLEIPQSPIDFGIVSLDDSVSYNMIIKNNGISNLEISNVYGKNTNITVAAKLPIQVAPMSDTTISIKLHTSKIGSISDTLFVVSNDAIKKIEPVPFSAEVLNYFRLVDNDDPQNYSESGQWNTSVTQAYNSSSRYAFIRQNPPAWAQFNINLKRSGIYDVEEILPVTVNSAKDAIYVLSIDDVGLDTIHVDQNLGSGDWVKRMRAFLPSGVDVSLRIIDSGESTPNAVLRADAIRFSMVEEITDVKDKNLNSIPTEYVLNQNYPNPFNPNTIISFSLPKNEFVTLKVYDVLGREVKTLVNNERNAGNYEINFSAENLSSGIYFYQLQAGKFTSIKKMILLK